MVTIKFKETGSEFEVKKGPAALLALSVAAAGVLSGGVWNKVSLPELPVPAAAGGKDPEPSSSSRVLENTNTAEEGATASVAPTKGIEELREVSSSQEMPTEVAGEQHSLNADSLIEWGKSLSANVTFAFSGTVESATSLAQHIHEVIDKANASETVASDSQINGVEGEVPLSVPILSTLSKNKLSTEPDSSLPEWVVQSAKEMGITDLAAVKEVAEGQYAYCFEGSCTPVINPTTKDASGALSRSISPVVGNFQEEESALSGEASPISEEESAPPAPLESVAQNKDQQSEEPRGEKTEAIAPPETEPPQNSPEPAKVPEPPQKIEVQEARITPLEIKGGVVEGLINGSVIAITENGKSERHTISLGPNIVGSPIRFAGKDLGTLSRLRSSDLNFTLKVNPTFKGTLELVPPEVLKREQAEAARVQREQREEKILGVIKKESSSLVIIDGASKNSPFVKEAIALVLAENRENAVLFVKSVPGPCPPCTAYQPQLKQLSEQIEREGLLLGGRKVVIVEALFTSFADADAALGGSKVPRTDLILPDGARKPTSASPNAKVFEYKSVSIIGNLSAGGLFNWATQQTGK